jgi:hypothetical protein
MTTHETDEERAATEADLLAHQASAQGISLRDLGYFGRDDEAPPAVAHLMKTELHEEFEGFEEDDEAYGSDEERLSAQRRAKLIRGYLGSCGVEMIAELFDDVALLRAAPGGSTPAEIFEYCSVISWLPPYFADKYDLQFAQQFLAVAVDLTTKMASKWEKPGSTAHDLAFYILTGKVAELAEMEGVDLGPNWRWDIMDTLIYDDDFTGLYEIEKYGLEAVNRQFENEHAVNMAFEDWFKPCNCDVTVPPYVHYGGKVVVRSHPTLESARGEYLKGQDWLESVSLGELVDVSALGDSVGFSAPLMMTPGAIETVAGKPLSPEELLTDEKVRAVLQAAITASREDEESTRVVFSVEAAAPDRYMKDGKCGLIIEAAEDPAWPMVMIQLSSPRASF